MNNLDYYREKKILITGGLGFVGVNLTSKLLSNDIQPFILDFIPRNVTINKKILPFDLNKLDFYNTDIMDQQVISDTIQLIRPDYIVHLAAITELKKDFKTAFRSVDVNIKGTLNLLKSIHKIPVSLFIFLSTSDVYGGVNPPFHEDQTVLPASPYSVSKVSAEMFSLMFNRVYNLPVTILRSFNLFGKHQKPNRVIPYIITQLLKEEEVDLTHGEQKREFNYVDNLLDAIFLAFDKPKSLGKIINVGCGKSISIREIALQIASQLDKIEKLNFGVIPYRPNEIWDMYCDNTAAKNILNWEQRISLDEGISQTVKWFQKIMKYTD